MIASLKKRAADVPGDHSRRWARVVSQKDARRYRKALEVIAADTIGKNARQIAERHVDTAREALAPGYSKGAKQS